MKIATVSFNSKWENKDANISEVERIVKSLNNKVEVVIFPETTLTGFSVLNPSISEDYNDSFSIEKIRRISVENRMKIIFGIIVSINDNLYNSLIAINDEGEVVSSYEKIHLFSYSDEPRYITAGNKVKSLHWKGGWGLSICFDLRFPELYQKLSKDNLVLLNIANWPKSRLSHWRALLQARAIENQSFMIGVNRVGQDGNGLEYEESSLVFSPKGELLEPVEIIKEVKIYELNEELAAEYRKDFPVKLDRKFELYKEYYK